MSDEKPEEVYRKNIRFIHDWSSSTEGLCGPESWTNQVRRQRSNLNMDLFILRHTYSCNGCVCVLTCDSAAPSAGWSWTSAESVGLGARWVSATWWSCSRDPHKRCDRGCRYEPPSLDQTHTRSVFVVLIAIPFIYWRRFFIKFSDLTLESTIMRGDFNCLTSPSTDRFHFISDLYQIWTCRAGSSGGDIVNITCAAEQPHWWELRADSLFFLNFCCC